MEKENFSKKIVENSSLTSLEEDEELAFIEYQENISRSKETKRNRLILISLTIAIYLLGLGVFATIVQTIYEIQKIVGIVVGITLVILYTICFIIILCQIFSRQSFDIELKKKENRKFSERKNNQVRFSIAKNIKEQSIVIDYLNKEQEKQYLPKKEAEKVDSFNSIITLSDKYDKHIPHYSSDDAKELSKALSIAMSKDGIIYKKAKALIMKRALSTGCLTALSQNPVMDMSIVVVKDMQLIKDLIWLYGFRPTTSEMNRIMIKVLRNICIAVGLNTLPKNASILSKVFNKDSSNFLVQLFGQVLDMGAQFLGNGTMTYLIGRYTVKVLLKQYHLQEVLSVKAIEEYQMELNNQTIKEINEEIEEEVKQIKKGEKIKIEDSTPLQLEDEKKNFFKNLFHHKKETKKK